MMIIEGWFGLFCLIIGPMLCVAAILICGLFKRKYVRSEWMGGLLEAEQLIKDGYVFQQPWSTDNVHVWFYKQESESFIGIKTKEYERYRGILDYVGYCEDNLKQFCKSLLFYNTP